MKKTDTLFIGFILGLLVIVAHQSIIGGSLFAALMVLINLLIQKKGATMAREEALKIGKVIADNWWANSRPIILSKQHIEKQKAWQQIKK